ncbi:MAG: GNAT family N-acetyltransferase [Oscillospiraceae bacterium]|nr:GNAT family N-acetyltransferase [Oscillospiraceae bacterium]
MRKLRLRGSVEGWDVARLPPTLPVLKPEHAIEALPLENDLNKSYMDSPFFMYRRPSSEDEFLENYMRTRPVYIVARQSGNINAFIKAAPDGETFIQNTPGYIHCTGMYCLLEHRGKGIGQNLLNALVRTLKTQGYTRLGVDFESLNPSGSGFWLKYFTAYTHSLVRRIDESVMHYYTAG